MEELELAIESDKAKPQIGQLSDLGLVEMTRHRQGQAVSEIFAKRCPHCQGNGYIMEDIKFASSSAEGEYRAKAAKIKLPMGNRRNNKFNKFNNLNQKVETEIKETEIIQEEKIEQTSNPSVEAQQEVVEINQERETKKKNTRKSRYDKKKIKQEVLNEKLAQTVINEASQIEPIIAENANQAIQEEQVNEELTIKDTNEIEEQTEDTNKEKKTTRSKRPNRNSQKRTRTTKRSAKKDEEA